MARSSGWVPNQHGAWAMLMVPALVGSVLLWREHGPHPAVAPLLLAWLVGYLAFNAASLWLKSRRRPRYRRPLLTYAPVAGVLGLVVVALAPHLLWWALAFGPLLGVGLWEAHRRRDRSLLSGCVTVVAACLLVLVVVSLGGWPPSSAAVLATVACTVYFLGTVLVVKTMLRERGSRAYLTASLGWHAAATLAFVPWPPLAGFFALTTVRAALLPWLARRGVVLRPVHIGLVEIVLSALLTVLLLS